jgi:cytochrome c oxidase subunit IV
MKHHIVSVKTYLAIITALLALTAVTVAAAFQDFGFLNTVIAITIAVVKGLLVVMFFMHLKYSARIVWLFAGAGFAWFVIMIVLLLGDYRSRGWQYRAQPWLGAAPAAEAGAIPIAPTPVALAPVAPAPVEPAAPAPVPAGKPISQH